MTWINKDGLRVDFAGENLEKFVAVTEKPVTRTMIVDYDAVTGNGLKFTADLDNNGTDDGWTGQDAYIPAGAYITKAYMVVTEAFTSGGATTLTIGTAEIDGTVIDADGVDAAIAKTVIDAVGDVVVLDGAQVGGVVSMTEDAYLYATVGTGPYTAGKAKLYLEFIVPNQ